MSLVRYPGDPGPRTTLPLLEGLACFSLGCGVLISKMEEGERGLGRGEHQDLFSDFSVRLLATAAEVLGKWAWRLVPWCPLACLAFLRRPAWLEENQSVGQWQIRATVDLFLPKMNPAGNGGPPVPPKFMTIN